jgi:hypothetical protein
VTAVLGGLCAGAERRREKSGGPSSMRVQVEEKREGWGPVRRSADRQRPGNDGHGQAVVPACRTSACLKTGEAARWGPSTVPGARFKRV